MLQANLKGSAQGAKAGKQLLNYLKLFTVSSNDSKGIT